MKTAFIRSLLCSFVAFWITLTPVSAQKKTDTTNLILPSVPGQPSPQEVILAEQTLKKANAQKTLTAMEVFGKIYQVSLENISADESSLGFKSTLFGVHKIFNPAVANASTYSRRWLERRVEPSLKFAYKENFSSMNATLGINLSLINANDKTSGELLNNNPSLRALISSFDSKALLYLQKLNHIINTGTPLEKKQAVESLAEFETIVRTGKADKMSKALENDLKAYSFVGDNGSSTTLHVLATSLNDKIDAVAKKIDNRWNVVLTPQLSYTFVQQKLQGYSLSANAIKGLDLIPAHTTQLKFKFAVIHGTDTIIPLADLNRRFFSNQFGINQVLFNKAVTNDKGESQQIPAGEFTLSAGYDFVYKGSSTDEKKSQPTFSAKLGFLIGKESWLLFPFSYNFERKEGVARVSLKVNLGEAPIKK